MIIFTERKGEKDRERVCVCDGDTTHNDDVYTSLDDIYEFVVGSDQKKTHFSRVSHDVFHISDRV
jgi:hypothetical protein